MKFFQAFSLLLMLFLSACATKSSSNVQTSSMPSHDEMVPAYYYAEYAETEKVKERLESAGFEIVSDYPVTEKSETIIVTDDELKAVATAPGRGFAAIQRILVDREHQRVSVSNPVYFGRAFLQDDFDIAKANSVTEKLREALGTLTPSPDEYEFGALADYQFMVGMPMYQEPFVLGEGNNSVLLDKLRTFNDGDSVVFTLDLGNDRTLVGYVLSKQTSGFVSKIGTQNAEILPYTILIENGRATALAAKYYLAISYPLLSMGEFMTIATVPGAIERELEQPFK